MARIKAERAVAVKAFEKNRVSSNEIIRSGKTDECVRKRVYPTAMEGRAFLRPITFFHVVRRLFTNTA